MRRSRVNLLPLMCLLWVAGCTPEPQPPSQPVAFSHKAHVDNEMACTSCHPGAETQAQAGLTPLAGCATCHRRAIIPDHPEVMKVIERFQNREPLAWNRVNVIPDAAMVHFKHKPHARAGVSCDSCHGNVGEMTVARQTVDVADMGWCVSCHQQQGASIDCLTCHH